LSERCGSNEKNVLMSAKAENGLSVVDMAKWLIAIAIMVGGLWAFYEFQDQVLAPVRLIGLLVSFALAFFVASMTDKGRIFVDFMKSANIERQKVVWPTRTETVQTTLVVLVVVILIGIFISIVDWGFGRLVSAFVG
jgi:preprotein translocase subunit SecE